MRTIVLAVTAVVLLAGCGSSSKQSKPSEVSAAVGPRLVLPPTALRAPFVQFGSGKQGYAYRGPGVRGDPYRFGRIGGWTARYRRRGSTTTKGPLVIDSNADVFKQTSGAKQDFAALRTEVAKTSPTAVRVAPLGDESLARTLTTGTGAFTVRYYTIAWRDRNVVATLAVNGFDKRVTVSDAMRLARIQDRRIPRTR